MADETTNLSEKYLTTAYSELCRSYQGLHEFRMKLLSFLPLASIAALLALGKTAASPEPAKAAVAASALPPIDMTVVIGYIGLFSALFTLALFIYEARGILMCHDFYSVGANLEEQMGVAGQFAHCNEQRELPCYDTDFKKRLAPKINNTVASCAVYSLVFSAWFFVALKFVFNIYLHKCALWAGGTGIVLGVISWRVLRVLTETHTHKAAPAKLVPNPQS